jgi:hypothetical protein
MLRRQSANVDVHAKLTTQAQAKRSAMRYNYLSIFTTRCQELTLRALDQPFKGVRNSMLKAVHVLVLVQ